MSKLLNRTWIVYEHISPSGKIYVGITSQRVKVRWQNGNGNKVVLQFDKEGNFIAKYSSAVEAARSIGSIPNSVTRCCRGEVKTLHKFKFMYEKDYKINS
jgi:hypothetical protein